LSGCIADSHYYSVILEQEETDASEIPQDIQWSKPSPGRFTSHQASPKFAKWNDAIARARPLHASGRRSHDRSPEIVGTV
jgi:hypothetical protein